MVKNYFVLLCAFLLTSCATAVPYNRSAVERIQIFETAPDRPYEIIQHIKGKAEAATVFNPQPSFAQAESALKQKASEIGADAIINLKYSEGVSWTSWKATWVEGDAIKWK